MASTKKVKKKEKSDFSKKKYKLGKLNPGAANATDTSFKSKKICIRDQQIIRTDMDNPEPSIRFKYSFSHTKHPNLSMRMEAYTLIHKYLKEYPQNNDLALVFGRLIEVASFGLIDKEDDVRSVVVLVNISLFEREFPVSMWKPFFIIWIQFVSLALGHLQPQIRSDVLKVIDRALQSDYDMVRLMIPHFPQLVMTISKSIDDKKKNSSRSKIVIRMFKIFLEERNRKFTTGSLNFKWDDEKECFLPSLSSSFFNSNFDRQEREKLEIANEEMIKESTIALTRKTPIIQIVIAWSKEELKAIFGKLLEDMADSWFDTMHLLFLKDKPKRNKNDEKNQKSKMRVELKTDLENLKEEKRNLIASRSKNEMEKNQERQERNQLDTILDRLTTLRQVFKACQIDDEEFWNLIPRSMISIVGQDRDKHGKNSHGLQILKSRCPGSI